MRSNWWCLAAGLLLVGCGQAPSGKGMSLFGRDDTYKFPTEVRDTSTDARAPALASIDKARWAEMNAFALRSTRAVVAQNEGNVAFCPVGLWSAGGVLLNASNGEANEASAALLGLKDPQLDAVNNAQRAWHASLPADGPFKQGLGVFMVWPVLVTHEFADSMARDYRADVLKIGSAGQGATNAINSWASRRTGGAVEEAVHELSKQTVFEIVHVAAFKDKWKQKFEQRLTRSGPFTCEDDRQVNVSYMEQTCYVASVDDPLWSGCAIPFEDERFAFVAMLPKSGTVESALAKTKILPQWGQSGRGVLLTMPKFRYSSNTDLLPTISMLGGGKLLSPPNDFRRMSIELDGESSVTSGLQRISVEANEDGFQASVVTDLEVTKGAADPEVLQLNLNRPFFWAIIDTKTGVYLFTGIIRDPSS